MTDAKHPPRLTDKQRADRAECAALLRAAFPKWGKRRIARAAAMIVDDPDEAGGIAMAIASAGLLAALTDPELDLYGFCLARCRHD